MHPTTNIDQLREKFLGMAPYDFDTTVESHFTVNEITAIKKYGDWLNAIWMGRVPLETDKLQHFYLAKNKLCDSRTGIENLWFKYKQLEIPF